MWGKPGESPMGSFKNGVVSLFVPFGTDNVKTTFPQIVQDDVTLKDLIKVPPITNKEYPPQGWTKTCKKT